MVIKELTPEEFQALSSYDKTVYERDLMEQKWKALEQIIFEKDLQIIGISLQIIENDLQIIEISLQIIEKDKIIKELERKLELVE